MPTTTITKESPTQRPPITFRLPKPGVSDPYFGFSRSFYYALEQRGLLKLVRIKDEGKDKGVTLIRYVDVLKLINEQGGAVKLIPLTRETPRESQCKIHAAQDANTTT